ncbi:MAG TPA: DUF5999 family protein [Actinocrinis sp.]|nr:DUF5999 family protein [Actinocrinis sp.]
MSQPHRRPQRGSCRHRPACPAAGEGDADAALVVDARPELGWFLLCNGTVRRTDGLAAAPHPVRIGDVA